MNPFTLINENSITLNNLNNQNQNLKNLFNLKNSIIYSGCFNMKIKFESGINKLIIDNSKELNFKVNKIISGIDLKNSNNIFISSSEEFPLYSLYFEKCNDIKIILNKNLVNKTKILIEDSNNINFYDYDDNIIDVNHFSNF